MKSWILIDGSGAESVVMPSNFHSTDNGSIVFEVDGVEVLVIPENLWCAVKPVNSPVEEEV